MPLMLTVVHFTFCMCITVTYCIMYVATSSLKNTIHSRNEKYSLACTCCSLNLRIIEFGGSALDIQFRGSLSARIRILMGGLTLEIKLAEPTGSTVIWRHRQDSYTIPAPLTMLGSDADPDPGQIHSTVNVL